MRDNLRIQNLIPTTSPYNDNLICDVSVFNTTGNDAIVDWVYIELRDANDNTNIIASRSALLQRDGDVVEIDGVSSIGFEIPGRPYYVSVKHRNHLGAMTLNTISLSRTTSTVDLTTNTVPVYGSNALTTTNLTGNIKGLWSGDVNSNGSLRFLGPANDTNALKNSIINHPDNTNNSNSFLFTGYINSDINLNGQVRFLGPSNDTNILKSVILNHPGNSSSSNSFLFLEQIPN